MDQTQNKTILYINESKQQILSVKRFQTDSEKALFKIRQKKTKSELSNVKMKSEIKNKTLPGASKAIMFNEFWLKPQICLKHNLSAFGIGQR